MTSAHARDLRGRWVNQNGSVLEIEVVEGGRILGVFESKKGRAARGKTYPMTGIVNGELVAFAVSFDDGTTNLASITSFSGRLARDADGTERLHTLWVLARQYEDDARTKPTHVWNTFLTNTDVFTRVDDDE
jgi:hypothetical protein